MKIKLHEIELNVTDIENSRDFYLKTLGLPLAVDQEGLKVFKSGHPDIDFNISTHCKDKIKISFLVDNIDKYVDSLRAKGVEAGDPTDTHLGMRSVILDDPDGHQIEIHSPTEESPEWLKNMI